ncbi:MAG TPA: outer membrane beta-barrel protein, partial [Thermoanaerobaculia bacterium]
TSDVDETFGGGVGFGFPFGESGLGLHAKATYYQELSNDPLDNVFDDDEGVFQDESLEVLPIDVGLHYEFAPDGSAFSPWIGGGFTYFMIDTTFEGVDVDDETGFHVSLGSRFGSSESTNFFVEAIYRSTESTLVREIDDDIDVREEVAIDLDGIAVNAGVMWRF